MEIEFLNDDDLTESISMLCVACPASPFSPFSSVSVHHESLVSAAIETYAKFVFCF